MPRTRRSKPKSPSPPPQSSERSIVHPDGNPTKELKANGGEGGNEGNPAASDGGESIDEALLDEEDTPEVPEEKGGSSTKESPTTQDKTGRVQGYNKGGYNELKSFHGQYYSGMAVGGSHTWNYDQGVWKETKEEPDLWRVDYNTTKRRARKAPKGSGAPVGTEYHWLIVAHQHVKKMDANVYETQLNGSKYKLAHKGATSNSWSIPTVKGQREREIELLDDAKRRVQGLPPVLGTEKVKVEKHDKGQQKLDALFAKAGKGNRPDTMDGKKRKRVEQDEENEDQAI